MKGKLISALKVVLPLIIGAYVIWYQFNQLSEDQLSQIKTSFADADYFWVILSISFGVLSHVSRAYRWNFALEPLGYKNRFINNFFGVMIGYVANIIIHRSGEVWRCVMVSRYEKAPFEKLFGTVVAERVADMIVLMLIVASAIMMNLALFKEAISGLLQDFLEKNSIVELVIKLGLTALVVLVSSFIGWRILMKSQNKIASKIRGLVVGMLEGITSILKMKQKWAFLAHTLFIWVMYLAMYYLPFLALPETSSAPISAVLFSFVMASFSIVLVQGGIGVYPFAVANSLVAYGIGYEVGFAMGWIIWVAQTVMIVVFGVASLVLMPMLNGPAKAIEQ